MISRRKLLKTLARTATGGAMLASYSIVIEPRYRLVVTKWTVATPAWPSTAAPLRIALLSDIHACEPWMPASRIADVVKRTMDLQPDLIALLGDYGEALGDRYCFRGLEPPEWAPPLGALRAPLGVYAILGNHDWWGDVKAVRKELSAVNIPVLENKSIKIAQDGHSFWLAGLADQLAYSKDGEWHGYDDLDGTLAQVTDGDPIILLAHEPDIFARTPARVAVTLSGHTHGGQVYVPFLGAPWIDSSPLGRKHVYGHVVEDGRHLIISGGLGLTARPVRFMRPPEINLVTVTSSAAPGV
jgi:uncharacterized protein